MLLNNGNNNGSTTISNSAGPSSGPTANKASATSALPLLLCADGERVLLLAYCILPGDEWLCAACTDERGALLDTVVINIAVPNLPVPPSAEGAKEWRHRQRHSQITDALQRLWAFAQSVMLQQEVRNWRLVSCFFF